MSPNPTSTKVFLHTHHPPPSKKKKKKDKESLSAGDQ
jgi:hypothetical protein